jgi:hypothetical protein
LLNNIWKLFSLSMNLYKKYVDILSNNQIHIVFEKNRELLIALELIL